ncbi:NosD domain-containing protein [Candidatus Altiarchaeota archaeon]
MKYNILISIIIILIYSQCVTALQSIIYPAIGYISTAGTDFIGNPSEIAMSVITNESGYFKFFFTTHYQGDFLCIRNDSGGLPGDVLECSSDFDVQEAWQDTGLNHDIEFFIISNYSYPPGNYWITVQGIDGSQRRDLNFGIPCIGCTWDGNPHYYSDSWKYYRYGPFGCGLYVSQNKTDFPYTPIEIECGDDIIQDTILTHDYYNCSGFRIVYNNITLDCNGHTIKGMGRYSEGIRISRKNWTTIKNCHIQNFDNGIRCNQGHNNKFIGNIISNSQDEGIWLYQCDGNKVQDNIVNKNHRGIVVHNGNYNLLVNNQVFNNSWDGIYLKKTSTNKNNTGNVLSSNQICFNNIDVRNQGTNTGIDNICDTTSLWNDTNTLGCTFSCMPQTTIPSTTSTLPATPVYEYTSPFIPIISVLTILILVAIIG